MSRERQREKDGVLWVSKWKERVFKILDFEMFTVLNENNHADSGVCLP